LKKEQKFDDGAKKGPVCKLLSDALFHAACGSILEI
jgi:hypothetical protein